MQAPTIQKPTIDRPEPLRTPNLVAPNLPEPPGGGGVIKRIRDLTGDLNATQKTNADLTAQVSQLNAALTESRAEIAKLKAKAAAKTQSESTKLSARNNDLSDELRAMKAAAALAETDAAGSAAEIKRLTTHLQALRSENGEVSDRIGEFVDQVNRLQTENAAFAAAAATHSKMLSAERKRANELTAELMGANRALATAEGAKTAVTRELAETNTNVDRVQQLEEQLGAMEAQLIGSAARQDALALDLEQAQKALAAQIAEKDKAISQAQKAARADVAAAQILTTEIEVRAAAETASANTERNIAAGIAIIAGLLAIFGFLRRKA